MLKSLKNHLANIWDRAPAARRGRGQVPVPLDTAGADLAYVAGFSAEPDAERAFARHWAQTFLERIRVRLEGECAAAGKAPLFAALRAHLQGDSTGQPYSEIAPTLGLSEGALKVAAHRLRHRFGELLQEKVALAVDDPAEVQGELRELIRLVGDPG